MLIGRPCTSSKDDDWLVKYIAHQIGTTRKHSVVIWVKSIQVFQPRYGPCLLGSFVIVVVVE